MNSTVKYKSLEPYRAVLVVVFLAVSVWYLGWRLGTINPDVKVFSWLLYAAEIFGFLTTAMHLFMTWRLTERTAPPPQPGLGVDVYITTINEPVDMVRRTALAAINMDYPHQTWLLDDGRRPEIARLAEELGCRYLTRDNNEHAKAGNLNNALEHSTGQFVAVFDADHAPARNFLTHTLGYFQDEKVAFVQTPQDFFNLDSYQHRWKQGRQSLWTEQSLFFRVIQRGKDFWNAAFFCGSCAVVRRSSLDSIGGFATGTVTEDLHTSIRLHKCGFKSVYHAESLAFGIAPATIEPFLRQRVRWGQGAMQVWRKESFIFAGGLSLAQRINYFASMATYFEGWQKGLFYFAPVIVLVLGVMPLVAPGDEFLLHFIPYLVLTFWVFEEVGRGFGRSLFIEQYNMARYFAFAWATLAFFKQQLRFRVTPKGSPRTVPSKAYSFLPQQVLLIANIVAIPVGVYLYLTFHHLPTDGVIANVIWAGINAGLATALLLFTARRKAQHKRADYRFPIPLPVKLCTPNGTKVLGTVDNLSSSGFRVCGQYPGEIGSGSSVEGELMLPSGPMPFRAEVTSILEDLGADGNHYKSLGCKFIWDQVGQRDVLDLFLYGSDLQWQVQNLQEQALTPLDLVFGKRRAVPRRLAQQWATIVYKVDSVRDAEYEIGMIAIPGDISTEPNAILFKPVPAGAQITAFVFGRNRQAPVHAKPSGEHRLDSPVAAIYAYRLTNCTWDQSWRTHRSGQDFSAQQGELAS